MRDVIVTLVVFGAVPFILMRPFVGIMMWTWLAYMNPHRLTWDFAYNFPFAQVTAIATLLAFVVSAEPKRFPWTPVTGVWLAFTFWMSLTTLFALNPEVAVIGWERAIKIQLFALLTLVVVTTRWRLNALIWMIVVSLGYFGIKGGIFTILTGGGSLIWGPPGSFIEDNNALALAMLMMVPLMRYLQLTATQWFIRWGLGAGMALVLLSALASYSRGAMLGVLAMAGFLWLKSKGAGKLVVGMGLVMLVPVVLWLLPEQWLIRMDSIGNYQQDGSAQARINCWWFSFNLAVARPILGGGFNTFTPELFLKYAPNPNIVADAHSIYFQVMAEHGFVGLALFLLLGWLAFNSASWIIKNTKNNVELTWARHLAAMLQLSLIGYAVSGAFLSLANFDLFYNIVGLVVILRVLVLSDEAFVKITPVVRARVGLTGVPHATSPDCIREVLHRPSFPHARE